MNMYELGKRKNHEKRTTPCPSNSRVFMSLGVDWLTFYKPGCVTNLRDISDEIIHTFGSRREPRILTREYEGVDLAIYGVIAARGSSLKVDFPGQALQHIRYSHGMSDVATCDWFLKRGFKATRTDGAMDCADTQLNPLIAYRYMQNGHVRAEASKWDYRFDKTPLGKQIFPKHGKGMTTYIGSAKSEKRIRIYDRIANLLAKGGEIPVDWNGNELTHLTRVEMQCRRESAHMLACEVVRRGIGVIRPIIGGWVSFLNPRDTRKHRRREVTPWWQRIVGEERRFLTLPQVVADPDRSIKWIKKQVIPTLKAMRVHAPEKWNELVEDWMADYELRAETDEIWKGWAKDRQIRREELDKLIQSEKEDDENWRVEKLLAAASPTVNEEVGYEI